MWGVLPGTIFLAVMLLSQTSPHRRWIVIPGGLLALLIGLSRLYLGVHYPSDVVGGWLLAIGWTVGLYRVMFVCEVLIAATGSLGLGLQFAVRRVDLIRPLGNSGQA